MPKYTTVFIVEQPQLGSSLSTVLFPSQEAPVLKSDLLKPIPLGLISHGIKEFESFFWMKGFVTSYDTSPYIHPVEFMPDPPKLSYIPFIQITTPEIWEARFDNLAK